MGLKSRHLKITHPRNGLKKWEKLVEHPRWGGGARAAIARLKDEKNENFVTFTSNLIPKSGKTRHFFNETWQFDFLELKNNIFSKFYLR